MWVVDYYTYTQQALTPPIRLYPPNAGPILPGMLGAAALGAQANVAAVAAGASAAAIQAAYDSSSKYSTQKYVIEKERRRASSTQLIIFFQNVHMLDLLFKN